MDFNLIVQHPDRHEIISRLIAGEDPKVISQWLQLKYGKDGEQHLHIPSTVMKSYMESHVDLLDQLQQDIKQHKLAKTSGAVATLTKNSKSYKSIIEELADKELDLKRMMTGLIEVIRSRTEQVFDKIQAFESEKQLNTKGDYALIKYFELLINAAEKLDKINNNATEKTVQHNYTVQYIDQNINVFHEAFRQTLMESFDYEVVLKLMETFNNKVMTLKAPVSSIETRKTDYETVSSMMVPELPQEIS